MLPHHERSNPEQVGEQIQDRLSDSLTILGIDAQTACLGSGGEWRVSGHGRLQFTVRKGGNNTSRGKHSVRAEATLLK